MFNPGESGKNINQDLGRVGDEGELPEYQERPTEGMEQKNLELRMKRILLNMGLHGESIVQILAAERLNWADFNTLLLGILEKRIKQIQPSDVMRNYRDNRFSAVAEVDPKVVMEIDRVIFGLLPRSFSAVELSPVNPIGANSALTSLDPKVVLPTIRNVEVVGDPSMALCIECAQRRQSLQAGKKDTETHLAASHRVLRLQSFPKDSGLSAHFRAFALVSGARDIAGLNRFELSALSTHIETWLTLLNELAGQGFKTQNIAVAVSDMRIMEQLIADGLIDRNKLIGRTKDKGFSPFKAYSINWPEQVESVQDVFAAYPGLETNINELKYTEKHMVEALRRKFSNVRFYFDLSRVSGLGYYSGLSYKITAEDSNGRNRSLAGGGACDWTRKLLNNRREHLVASGFGTEFFVKSFKSP